MIRLAGLAAVGVGTILAIDGPDGVSGLLRWLVSHVGMIILGVTVVGLLHNIAPRGSVVGPGALGTIGLAVVMFQEGWWPPLGAWPMIGIGIALAGGFIVMQENVPPPQPAPIRRVVGALFNREVIYLAGQDAPQRLSVIALGCRVNVNLASAGLPRYEPVEINIACLLGHVEIALPNHWPVVAGRVGSTRSVRLTGLLDSADTFDDPQAEDQLEALHELVARRRKAARMRKPGSAVVVHIVGFGGGVTVLDRS